MDTTDNANAKQVGGTHYAGEYQHWDLVRDVYDSEYLVGNATKYIVRHHKKNGRQDVEKAKHYVEKLKEKMSARRGGYMDADHALNIARFCHMHQIGATEHNLLLMLAYANSVENLDGALALLDVLMEREYPAKRAAPAVTGQWAEDGEEPAGRGYVSQD